MATKTCTKCGEVKGLGEFYLASRNGDGRQVRCKECRKRWAKEHRQEVREYRKKYRKNNKEKINKSHSQWRKKNLERQLQYERNYRKNNKEAINKSGTRYRRANLKEHNRKNRERLQKQKEKLDDGYIKKLICETSQSLKHKDIPDEMVRIRRTILKFKHYEKEKENGQKRNQSISKESRRCVG